MLFQSQKEQFQLRTQFLISHRYFVFLVQEEERFQILNSQNIEFGDNQKLQ